MGVKPEGKAALEQNEAKRQKLLADLYAGERNTSEFTAGVCYDAVAFCLALAGRLDRKRVIDGKGGQHLLEVLNFDGGIQWAGDGIAQGSAVGFKRIKSDPGYFHAAIAVGGGTMVRGTNSLLTTSDWSKPFDLCTLGRDGRYEVDNQLVELRYI